MSLLQTFRNLSPRMRLGVGVGMLAWGAIGLQLSDRAEDKYGLKASEKDHAALNQMVPTIVTVDKAKGR
ncbi:putative fatty acid activator Faa4 [Pseudomassariella vexata]|uniref:Putative fatty acid activator Faa4 n=1 Tax=Pseudomassariella vexata TaxID=1141098 RepID=A0A1Y2DV34_9PEZI|nr:putative fatty acid activator Faa4 [Pseudomassariella vexata]ORY63150.1 putative fatty acid activator Faa4 [Pseudomassariella vexata]